MVQLYQSKSSSKCLDMFQKSQNLSNNTNALNDIRLIEFFREMEMIALDSLVTRKIVMALSK